MRAEAVVIAVVVPHPASWAEPLVRSLGATVLSPPPRLVRAWMAAAGADAPRRIRATLALRRSWDRLVARTLASGVTGIVAPTLGARACLAEASRRGIPGVLIDDLPDLERLHEGLDRAFEAHPDCGLLARHRAPRHVVAGQRAERVLATLRIGGELPLPTPVPKRLELGPDLLLAGPPLARSGAAEALAAAERLGRSLIVRPCEVMEPSRLTGHPLVRVEEEPRRAAVVLAPSWVPTRPAELLAAARGGVPTIATPLATSPGPIGRRVEPGDVSALCAAIVAAEPRHPWVSDPNRTTVWALRRALGLPEAG